MSADAETQSSTPTLENAFATFVEDGKIFGLTPTILDNWIASHRAVIEGFKKPLRSGKTSNATIVLLMTYQTRLEFLEKVRAVTFPEILFEDTRFDNVGRWGE